MEAQQPDYRELAKYLAEAAMEYQAAQGDIDKIRPQDTQVNHAANQAARAAREARKRMASESLGIALAGARRAKII